MKIYETSVRNPVSTIMIFIGVVVFGIFSMTRLSIDLYPDMEIPYLMVFTTYPGASAADIETNVTRLMENNLNTVSNLKKLTSSSSDNFSLVAVQFEWGTNLDEATNEIRDAVSRVEQYLPQDADRPSIFKINTNMIPILFLSVTAEESLPALGKLLEDKITNPLNRIEGVGAVGVSGAPVREIQVNLDPAKMEAYHLTIEQIGQVIATENINVPAGTMDIGSGSFSIRSEGEFRESDELKRLVVSRLGGNTVLLGDVAEVKDTIRKITQEVRRNGLLGAQIVIQKQSGANAVAISKEIIAELPILAKDLPPDVHIEVMVSTADFIEKSINSLTQTVMIVFIVVTLVVLFFLGRWRATFIIVLTIPVSLVTSFIYLFATGGTLNIITLSSFTIAISLVVDDAIVILENVTKHIEKGSSPREAAIYGTNEVWLAIIATTFTLLAVFFPLTMVGGIAGIMFKPFSWIIIIVTTVSTVAAISLTPMLASKLLTFQSKAHAYKGLGIMFKPIDKFLENLDNGYAKILTWSVRHRTTLMIITLGVFVASLFLLKKVPVEFMPESDQGQISVTIELEQGRSMDYTKRVTAEVTEYIQANFPEIDRIASTTGASDGSSIFSAFGTSGSNVITFTLRCVDLKDRNRSIFLMGDLMREKFKTIPEIVKYTVDTSGSGGAMGGGAPIEVKVFGHDFDVSEKFARDLMAKMESVKGVRDLKLSREDMKLEYRIIFDREKLALYGLNTATVSTFIRNRINGMTASRFREDGDEFDIMVRYAERFRESIEDIENIRIYGSSGQTVRVKDVGSVVEYFTPPTIQREDRQRLISVTASLYDAALGEVVPEINKILAETEIPQGISVAIGGSAEEQQESFGDMGLLLVLIVLLVYIVMATQFESLLMPFIIMFTLPFAFTGVFLALFLTNTPLSLIALIGALMLVGIVVKNGIVMVDFTNLLRERGLSVNHAVIQAGKSRLRPVLMTSLTTIFGLLPLAFGIGEGSEIWQPMGVAIIGGMTVSTALTLIVIPTKMEYTTGITISVNAVETVMPPMMATPIGCHISEPSPMPNANGSKPKMVVNEVIRTGRKRDLPA
jgi:HAE1 family hydrophobic/amphiphilic exporter-1